MRRQDDSAVPVRWHLVADDRGRAATSSSPWLRWEIASVRAIRFNASSPAACHSGMAASAKARCREVMRQHLGLGGLDVREALLDHAGDLGVQLLPAALEQRVHTPRPAPVRA